VIKGRGRFNDVPTLLLGLSEINCQRLQAGEPIVVNGAELGFPMQIVVTGGRTESASWRNCASSA
jgi:hypothetical protein